MRQQPLTVKEPRNPSVMKVTELLLQWFHIAVGASHVQNPKGHSGDVAAYEGVNGFAAIKRRTHNIRPHAQSTKGKLGRPHLS